MLKIPDIFPSNFWQVKLPQNPNDKRLDSSCRGQTKGALVEAFQEIGLVGNTPVFYRKGGIREIKPFDSVSDDATYRGRANKVSGFRGGMYHSFAAPEAKNE